MITPTAARPRLFLVSFLILFLELACIRWFGSSVIFLTFFTNIILMASFLGMSVGLLSASGKRDWAQWTVPILALACALALVSLGAHEGFSRISVDVGSQSSPQQIFFGTEYRAKDPSRISIPIELIAGVFFTLIALVFVGLGQIMGRAFNAINDRIEAYTADIAGSICGIVVFGLCSYFELPPLVWFTISLFLFFMVKRGEGTDSSTPAIRRLLTSVAALCILLFVAFPEGKFRNEAETYWSPYYKINYVPPPGRVIFTNNIGHQEMRKIETQGPAYCLPHLLNRDAGGQPFGDVLIIGAGSGNDVQAALSLGAKSIDAVEIDPRIQKLGMRDHPDQPYSDPRVTRHNDDGRSFVRKTQKKYDLVVYALVDSLVLHSGYSSLRLESFLFTKQAMEDIKAKLKPGGMFAMYNFYRQGWVVERLAKGGKEVFGTDPIVFSLPHRDAIRTEEAQFGSYTFILCGGNEKIKQALAKHGNFWVNSHPKWNVSRNGYGAKAPAPIDEGAGDKNPKWLQIAPAQINPPADTIVPDDNWPFLYLRDRTIPGLNIRGIVLIGVLSLALLFLLGIKGGDASGPTLSRSTFNWQMFFLGAGFMLLETKSVVHMALLFGSTWVVNSFVFGTILLMILLSNIWVAKTRPKNILPYYVLLIVTLAIGLLVPMNTFLALPGAAKIIASCAITFVPVFFAGVVFSTAFRESRKPDVDFGSNVAGIILGGLLENLSLATGFNELLGVAALLYVLSWILTGKSAAAPEAPASTVEAPAP